MPPLTNRMAQIVIIEPAGETAFSSAPRPAPPRIPEFNNDFN